MNTNKKTPKLRFKGFTDDWEQRKLSEVVTINPKTELPDKFKYVDLESVVGTNLLGFQVIKKENAPSRAQRLASYGDVFYQTVRPYQRNNYLFENIDKDMVFSTGYAQLRSKLDSYFLLTLVQNDNFVKVVLDNCTGTSYPAINGSELGKITVQIPSNGAEANQIGKVFRGIDNIITLHQRKLEKLKLNKSALLQKLFPQKGCTIPDVRFKGFTDAWEQRKLNDFGIATGGTSIESEFVDGGTYKVINIGSYSEESVYNDQGLRVNKTDKTKSRILNKYDLTMILNDKTASGNIIGRVLLIDQDNTYVYNQRTERIEVDTKNFLPMFLYHMLNAPEQRKYIVKASQGNTQIYVNWSTISNIDYMIPQLLLEQEKIANLFSLINKDITLHQRKLDCLISIKKGLLQQLFV